MATEGGGGAGEGGGEGRAIDRQRKRDFRKVTGRGKQVIA